MTDNGLEIREQARRVVSERYPEAYGAVLGGSAAQGLATTRSDLDIGVLVPDRCGSGREVLRFEGRQVEVFRNAVGELPGFFAWDRGRLSRTAARGALGSGETDQKSPEWTFRHR